MGKYYGFIDCEFTSGYAPRLQSVELIALGCVIIDQTNQEVARYEQLVRPTKKSNQKLTRRIRELTNLTQEEINQAPPFAVFVREFEAELQRYEQDFAHDIVWWSWGDYDQVALKQTLVVNNYTGRFAQFVEKIQDLQPHVIPPLFAKIGIKKHQLSLVNSKRIFGLGETIQHQALADALDLKQVFLAFRHQEPNWELVETFRPPLSSQQASQTRQPTTQVHFIERTVPTAEVYGLLKQLWQLAPPLIPSGITWQHRRCVLTTGEAWNVRDLHMQWFLVEPYQITVTVWHADTVICSHTMKQTKQNLQLFQTLIMQLTRTAESETVRKEGGEADVS